MNWLNQQFPTDEKIIEGIRSDDAASIRAMWKKYDEFKTTVAHLRNLGADWVAARSCANLAVVNFVQKMQQGEPMPDTSEGCIGKWINQSAEWKLKDWNRQQTRWQQVHRPPPENSSELERSDLSAIKKRRLEEEIEAVKMYIAQLSPKCREYITKRYVEEVDLKEFPKLFPSLTTEDVVKNSIAKCLKKLRELLANATEI